MSPVIPWYAEQQDWICTFVLSPGFQSTILLAIVVSLDHQPRELYSLFVSWISIRILMVIVKLG